MKKTIFIMIAANLIFMIIGIHLVTSQPTKVIKEVSCSDEKAAGNFISTQAKLACQGRWTGQVTFNKDNSTMVADCTQ